MHENLEVDNLPTTEVSRPQDPIVIQMENDDTIVEDLENDQLINDKSMTFMSAKQ